MVPHHPLIHHSQIPFLKTVLATAAVLTVLRTVLSLSPSPRTHQGKEALLTPHCSWALVGCQDGLIPREQGPVGWGGPLPPATSTPVPLPLMAQRGVVDRWEGVSSAGATNG